MVIGVGVGLTGVATRSTGGGVPSWVLKAAGVPAVYQSNYKTDQYWLNGEVLGTLADRNSAASASVSVSAAGSRYNSAGTLVQAAANVLRQDYDPTDGNSALGLLLEGSRTNLNPSSENLQVSAGNTIVNGAATTITADQYIAPDGSMTVERFVTTGGAADQGLFREITTSVLVGDAYSGSAWGYFPSSLTIRQQIGRAGTGTSEVSATSKTGSGLVRFGLTHTFANAQTGVRHFLLAATSAAQTFGFWGAQLEKAAFASSYIKTTGSAATRAADAYTEARAGEATGSLVIGGRTAPGASGNQVLWQWDDGSEDNRIRVVRDGSRVVRCIVTSGGVEQANLNLGVVADNTDLRIAFRWAADDFAASLDGLTAVSDTSGSVPVGLTTIRRGASFTGEQWFGHLGVESLLPSDQIDVEVLAGADAFFSQRVAFGIIGQSNEAGYGRALKSGGDPEVATDWQDAYTTSVEKPAITDPIWPAHARASMWPRLVDRLVSEKNVDAIVVNGAVGGLWFRVQIGGEIQAWSANSQAFRKQRSSEGAGDYGDRGTLIVVGSAPNKQLWRCTEGNRWLSSLDGASPSVTINGTAYTNLSTNQKETAALSGSLAPNWSSVTTPGDTITDGDLTWTLVEQGTSRSVGESFAYDHAEFDPMGLLARVKANLDQVAADQRWLLVENAQSDAYGNEGSQPTAQAQYQAVLVNIANWGLAQGYKVALGLSCYTEEHPSYRYDSLDAAWEGALASFAGNPNVVAGANLYRTMGTAPKLYPELSLTYPVHMSVEGLAEAADDWFDALAPNF